MQIKTRAIVISTMKYKDTSLIVRMYTEELGSRSYIVSGVRKAKGKISPGLFQPFTLLEIIAYEKVNQDLHRLSDAKIDQHYNNIPFNLKKMTVIIFLSELLGKILREEDQNKPLYHYIHQSMLSYDIAKDTSPDFHIIFLYHLARYCGLEIENAATFVHLLEDKGIRLALSQPELESFDALIHQQKPLVDNGLRKKILLAIVQYYQNYLVAFTELKSLKVLAEVFSS